ncbi:acetyltransferase [Clostridia bacterium]|nr:acetyltransferase [Clostridia bacterium]
MKILGIDSTELAQKFPLTLRAYRETDREQIFQLFFDTVHSVNAKDYSQKQRDVWAEKNTDVSVWCAPLNQDYTLVAEKNSTVVGFGNIDNRGYLDRLYTHKDYQGQGIATKIADALEHHAKKARMPKVIVHASITAKPFFENRGYIFVCGNEVKRGDQTLINYKMEKIIK